VYTGVCVYDRGRTDNDWQVNGLQLDQPATLGSPSVKTVTVLPSRSAPGVIQFATSQNITGLSAAVLEVGLTMKIIRTMSDAMRDSLNSL